MHQIGPLPSHGSWSFSMHVRPCHRSNMDTRILLCSWRESAQSHMMQFKILSFPLLGMLGSMFCTNKHMFSQCHLSKYHDDKWILCKWYLHFGTCNHCWPNSCKILFCKPLPFEEWLWQLWFKQTLCQRNWHHEDDFILVVIKIFDVYISKQIISFIDVPTWHGQQRALEVTLFQLYIHFISKGCQWLLKKFKPPLFCIEQLWQ